MVHEEQGEAGYLVSLHTNIREGKRNANRVKRCLPNVLTIHLPSLFCKRVCAVLWTGPWPVLEGAFKKKKKV